MTSALLLKSRVLAAAALAIAGGLAAAQEGNFPNPLQRGNVVATCDNWPAQRRAADPAAMQALSGVWEGSYIQAGVPGLMPDTPIQFRSTNNPNGTFTIERYGCFAMQSVPGMPPLGTSCSTSMIYGEWVAHFAEGGSIASVTMAGGSSFTGEALPMSCGIGFYWRVDPNTLVDQSGNRLRRVG